MRPGPATRAASYVVSCLAEWPLQPDSARRSAAFAKARCRSVTLGPRIDNRHGWPAAFPAPKSRRGGGRNARATSPRLRALSGVPPAIHPRESPAAAGSAAIIRKPRNSHVSLPTLSARSLRLARQKTCAVVKKLWRMRLPCGRPRKT